ncbi:MAG TPA: methyl-accepting chemotaxis protein [Caulobacteraceae bacterium]|jgi:methyl-accepting chemotaxis protein
MSFNDLTIGRKLAVGFTGVVSIVVAMSLALFVALGAIHGATAANDESQSKLAAADAALSALVEQQNAVRGYVGSGDDSFPSRVRGFAGDFDKAWRTLNGLTVDPAQKSTLQSLKAEAANVMAQEDGQMAMRRDPAQVAAAQASLPKVGRLTAARALLKSITDPERALVVKRSAGQAQAFQGALLTLMLGSLVAIALSAITGWLLARGIASPVRRMTQAMNELAAGALDVTVPDVSRADEVGQMAGAVQTFKDAAIAKRDLEAKADAERTAAAKERAQAEAERSRVADEQAQVVQGVARGLERLSAGDLTRRLEQPFAPAYEKLRADFNAAMEQLQQTIRVVATNAAAIRSGASEISQASDDLSRRTEQQAASLEETAAALDEITATVRKTAEGARLARDKVGAARADAEVSGKVVGNAVAAMSEIEQSAQQISQIIGVIDEIAFQTNLLALNAGVEAARAGDAGKGFAVVASEVRALAQRSAEAAKEIKALISASTQQVGRGVGLVRETGEVLERIVAQVGGIDGLVGDIAASAQEQASGLAQVNTAVNQMDQVTQQNAAMVEQSTAASHALTGETEAMSRQIARFQLGETPIARTRRAA